MLLALQRGSLFIVSVLAGLVPVVTVVLARFILKERIELRQLVGLALAIIAVLLMTI